MIDHLTLLVSDFDRALAFYRAALAPLGYAVVMQFTRAQMPDLPAPAFAGLGAKGKPDLWLRAADGLIAPTHVAFAAPERATVDAFYAAALAAGARDNGPPGLRPQYHPHYYGAFVLDPDGYNIEAVCHKAPSAARGRPPPRLPSPPPTRGASLTRHGARRNGSVGAGPHPPNPPAPLGRAGGLPGCADPLAMSLAAPPFAMSLAAPPCREPRLRGEPIAQGEGRHAARGGVRGGVPRRDQATLLFPR